MLVENIITEPTSTSTHFIIYGTRGQSGVMVSIDFASVHEPTCKG